jgi:hypothetical protein
MVVIGNGERLEWKQAVRLGVMAIFEWIVDRLTR